MMKEFFKNALEDMKESAKERMEAAQNMKQS